MPRVKAVKRQSTSALHLDVPKKKKVIVDEPPAEKTVELKSKYTDTGVILAFGSGDVGQLGLGEDILEKSRPALVSDENEYIDIRAGGMHNICLKEDGTVITWGCNDEGALGRQGDEFTPASVKLPNKAVMISAGDSHSAALLKDGRVFAWGNFRDGSGGMGLDSNGVEKIPVEILPKHIVVQIASGADHLVMLTDKGEIYTVGCGQQGQLGRLSSRETNRDRRHGIGSSLKPGLVIVKASKKMEFSDIFAGIYCTFAIEKSQGTVHVFGLNNYSQLGLPKEEPYYRPVKSNVFNGKTWTKIEGGQHHTIALDSDGKVYALGRKEYGRLGLGENCEDAKELTLIPKLADKKCRDIACGESTSFAVTENGDLYAWGFGTGGALGNGEEDDLLEPTLIKGKQLSERHAIKVSGGGQHTVVLATSLQNNNTNSNN